MGRDKKRKHSRPRSRSNSRARVPSYLVEKLKKLETAVELLSRSRSRSSTSRSRSVRRSPPRTRDAQAAPRARSFDRNPSGNDDTVDHRSQSPLSPKTQQRQHPPSPDLYPEHTHASGEIDSNRDSPVLELQETEKLDDELVEILGENPTQQKSSSLHFSAEITSRWQHVLIKGLTKDEKIELSSKYQIPSAYENLRPPAINPEINSILSPETIRRDGSQTTSQSQLMSSILAQGQIIQLLIDKVEGIAPETRTQILKWAWDSSRLLTDLFYRLTLVRRQRIYPFLSKTAKDLLMKTAPEEGYLFGPNIGEQVKTAVSMQRVGKDIKAETISNNRPYFTPRRGYTNVNENKGSRVQRDRNFHNREQPSGSLNRNRPTRQAPRQEETTWSRGRYSTTRTNRPIQRQ